MFPEGEGKIRPIDFVSSTEVRSKLRNLSDWSGEFSIYKVIESTYGGHIDAIHTHITKPDTSTSKASEERERDDGGHLFVGAESAIREENSQESLRSQFRLHLDRFRRLQTASDRFIRLEVAQSGEGESLSKERQTNRLHNPL